MSEQQPQPGGEGRVAEAVVATRSRPSIVWLIPLVAALVGAFVAYRTFSERGPAITIRFQSAEGLEAGKTEIKYKDVAVGLVESIELEPDLSGVIVHARMVKGAEHWLTDRTRFWVVKPRVAGGQVSGLGTLLSGAYLGVDPVTEGESQRHFDGLAEPPLVAMKEAGRYVTLVSDRAGAVDIGTPVYFRRISVGQVVSSELDPKGDSVTTKIFVRAPYDQRVRADSRFWNAGGFEASLGADGVQIEMQSVVSLLIGGIAFDAPHGESAENTEVAPADAVFPLYENKLAADQRHYTHAIAWLLRFDQSVRGLKVGAPVEFRGIPIGQVTDVRIEFDPAAKQFRIPVTIEIEPERFTQAQASPEEKRATVDKLVAAGMRAQLKSGSLITGSLFVSLDFFPSAKPAQVAWDGPIPEFPTTPTPIEEITANLTQIVDRLNKIPVEQIGTDLGASLKSLRATLAKSENIGPALTDTLAQTQKTLASVGPDSTVNTELRRALLELSDAARALGLAADQIQTQPNSLLFGKGGSK
jgi:paraquat-inducible protein B